MTYFALIKMSNRTMNNQLLILTVTMNKFNLHVLKRARTQTEVKFHVNFTLEFDVS